MLAQAPEGDAAVPPPVPRQDDGVAREPPPVQNKSTFVAVPTPVPGQDYGVARKPPPVHNKTTFVPAKAPACCAWKTPNDGFLMGGGNLEDVQTKLPHAGALDKPPNFPTKEGEKENGKEKSGDDHSPLMKSNFQPALPPKPSVVQKLRSIRERLKSEDNDNFLNQVQQCSKTASNTQQKYEGMRSRSRAIQDKLTHQLSTAKVQWEAEPQPVLNLEVALQQKLCKKTRYCHIVVGDEEIGFRAAF